MTKTQIVTALREELTAKNARMAGHLKIHNALRDVIAEKWTGKKVNKRILTHLRDKLGLAEGGPECLVLKVEFDMASIVCWGGSFGWNYDNRENFFLGYANERYGVPTQGKRLYECLTVEGFEESDLRNGKNTEKAIAYNNEALADGASLACIAEAMLRVKEAEKDLEYFMEGDKWSCVSYKVRELMKGNL